MDFYPDSFESDMYGSTYEYEAISLIPFLDHAIVSNVYQKAIEKVDPVDMQRNQIGKTQLYEYNSRSAEISVESPFPHIPSFKSSTTISKVDLRKEF